MQEAYKFTKSLFAKVKINWIKEQIDAMRKREAAMTPAELGELLATGRLGTKNNLDGRPEPNDRDEVRVEGHNGEETGRAW